MNNILWREASRKTKQTVILSQLMEEIPAESCRWKNDFHQTGSFFGDLLADTQISLLDS